MVLGPMILRSQSDDLDQRAVLGRSANSFRGVLKTWLHGGLYAEYTRPNKSLLQPRSLCQVPSGL